jgi:hypothetical protein
MSAAQRQKLQAAMQACGADFGGRGGAAGRGDGRRPDVTSTAYRKAIRAYTACVRKNGYDLPDPDFSGKGPIFDAKKVDQDDATFKKASAACQSTLRSAQPQGGSANGSGDAGAAGGSGSSGTTTSAADATT